MTIEEPTPRYGKANLRKSEHSIMAWLRHNPGWVGSGNGALVHRLIKRGLIERYSEANCDGLLRLTVRGRAVLEASASPPAR